VRGHGTLLGGPSGTSADAEPGKFLLAPNGGDDIPLQRGRRNVGSQSPLTVSWYWWRATWRGVWRPALVVILLTGLLGAVSMASLAGARRTVSAYGRYLQSVHASDVMVNIPSPDMSLIAKVEHLPGVRSSAAWAGLDANPVVHGRVDDSFLTDAVSGSVDGGFYRQDTLSVLRGRLPRPASTNEIALTPGIAKLFGVGVGGTVRYQLYDAKTQKVVGSARFRVTAVVEAPPALVDQFDETEGAFLSRAATVRYGREIAYSWVGIRLDRATAGLSSFQSSLTHLTRQVGHGYAFEVRRMGTVHRQVQNSIRPQAVALAVFGGLAALALLVLVGQSLAQWLERSAVPLRTLRAFGLTRRQAVMTFALGPALAVGVGVGLAVVGAVALSPLAPLEPVRQFDPVRGAQFDAPVLLGGASILAVALAGVLASMAWRRARRRVDFREPASSAIAQAAVTAGLPRVVTLGIRFALEPPPSGRKSAVRANLIGTVTAVLAVVTAAVFGASLDGLVSHPDRYGWNWNVLIQNQGGYGTFVTSANPASFHGGDGALDRLMKSQKGIAGWSTFGFTQLLIDGQTVPVLGLATHRGAVEPPTVSGRPLHASARYRLGPRHERVSDQIELGATTLRQLGKHVGDTVVVGAGRSTRRLTVVGVVTLPSIGVGLTDHVSLGTGAMLSEATLLSVEGLHSLNVSSDEAVSALPTTVAIDLAPGTRPASVARPIVKADLGAPPGGVYQVPRELGAAIVDANQMSGQPLALALSLGVAALVSLSAAVAASARRRRRELAILQTLGMTRRQLRSIIMWQTLTLLLVAIVVGLPLGILAGRWTWAGFATSLGVVPVTVVPVTQLVVGLALLVVAGPLFTSLPRVFSQRTSTAASLRSE
jgi:FtsX-like permease family